MTTPSSLTSSQQPIRIGLFGGTFDPIHNGHIYTAIDTAKWLNLDTIHLIPTHIPPHKSTTGASAKHRAAMVELVCQQFELFKLDQRELARKTPSYTVDTLEDIKKESPHSQIFFIVGMDSLINLTSWHQWQKILTLTHIVVNERPSFDYHEQISMGNHPLSHYFTDKIADLFNTTAGKIIINKPTLHHVSSTAVRSDVSANKIPHKQLPPQIISYILQHQLYKSS